MALKALILLLMLFSPQLLVGCGERGGEGRGIEEREERGIEERGGGEEREEEEEEED